MSDKTRCKICSSVMYRDEECARCSGAIAPAAPEKDRHIPYTGPLPSLDPYVQSYIDKHGRTAQRDLYPECDDINGGRR